MKNNRHLLIAAAFFAAFGAAACSPTRSGETNVIVNNAAANNAAASNANAKIAASNGADAPAGEIANETEKIKPAAGKGNVQGTVLFDDKPAANIEVKLCEKFSTILGVSCTGKVVKAKTDVDGVYVLANAEPLEYEGLAAKVFASDYYISPQAGILRPQTFKVEPDKTIFANDINLFKDDVKIVSPKAGGKANATNLELKWNPYPNAAYYKLSLHAEEAAIPSTLSGERIEDTVYTLDRTLDNGKYRIAIEAYNTNNRKLAESPDDYKFTVTGGNQPTAETTPEN